MRHAIRWLAWGLLAAAAPAWAENELRPRFDVGTSLVFGNATELVLRDGTYNNPISRLQWPVSPTLSLDFAVEWPWTSWLSTAATVRILSPFSQGTLVDEDWNTGPSARDLVYGKSEHTAYLTNHWSAEVSQEFRWEPLTASLGFLYRWAAWEGWNGTGTYHYVDNTTQSVSFTGPVIAYHQQWFIPTVGLSWKIAGVGWTLRPRLLWGPYVWGLDRDDHNYAQNTTPLQAPLTFLDSARGGILGRGGIEVSFAQPSGAEWGVRGEWQAAWGAVGETVITTSLVGASGTSFTFASLPDAAGAWFQETSLSLFVRN